MLRIGRCRIAPVDEIRGVDPVGSWHEAQGTQHVAEAEHTDHIFSMKLRTLSRMPDSPEQTQV